MVNSFKILVLKPVVGLLGLLRGLLLSLLHDCLGGLLSLLRLLVSLDLHDTLVVQLLRNVEPVHVRDYAGRPG